VDVLQVTAVFGPHRQLVSWAQQHHGVRRFSAGPGGKHEDDELWSTKLMAAVCLSAGTPRCGAPVLTSHGQRRQFRCGANL
jgi:hypothetical protein